MEIRNGEKRYVGVFDYILSDINESIDYFKKETMAQRFEEVIFSPIRIPILLLHSFFDGLENLVPTDEKNIFDQRLYKFEYSGDIEP